MIRRQVGRTVVAHDPDTSLTRRNSAGKEAIDGEKAKSLGGASVRPQGIDSSQATEASLSRRRFSIGVQPFQSLTNATPVQYSVDEPGSLSRTRARAAFGIAVINLRVAHRRLLEAIRHQPQLAGLVSVLTVEEHDDLCRQMWDEVEALIGGAR